MNRLKELRKEKKQTQKEFAKETGTPLRTLQSWENGESQIKPDKAQQLADYFGVSVGYLLGYSNYRENSELKNLVYDTQNGVAAGETYDKIAQIIGEKRMKRFLTDTASNDFIHYTFIDNDNSVMHTKEARMIILFSLLDNSDKQIVSNLIESLASKVAGENFEGYPLDKWLEIQENQ